MNIYYNSNNGGHYKCNIVFNQNQYAYSVNSGYLSITQNENVYYGLNGNIYLPYGITNFNMYNMNSFNGYIQFPPTIQTIHLNYLNGYKRTFDVPETTRDLRVGYGFNGSINFLGNNIVNLSYLFGGTSSNTQPFNKPINFPKSTEYMYYALSSLTNFKQDVVIPEKVKYADCIFYNCPNMRTSVNITVESKDFRFNDMSSSILQVLFGTDYNQYVINAKLNLKNAVFNTFNRDGNRPIPATLAGYSGANAKFYGTVILPDAQTNFTYFFSGCNFFNNSVTIPDNAISINSMFWGCNAFNRPIIIPDNVKYMSNTFQYCNSFSQNIRIPNNVKNMVYAFNYTFRNSVALSNTKFGPNIYVSNSVINFYSAFGYTSYINNYSIYFESGDNYIDLSCGFYNSGLNQGSITLPNLISNASSMFYNCQSMNANFGVLPDSLGGINVSSMFYNCRSLNQTIIIPPFVDVTNMFNNCTNLTVIVPKYNCRPSGVKSIVVGEREPVYESTIHGLINRTTGDVVKTIDSYFDKNRGVFINVTINSNDYEFIYPKPAGVTRFMTLANFSVNQNGVSPTSRTEARFTFSNGITHISGNYAQYGSGRMFSNVQNSNVILNLPNSLLYLNYVFDGVYNSNISCTLPPNLKFISNYITYFNNDSIIDDIVIPEGTLIAKYLINQSNSFNSYINLPNTVVDATHLISNCPNFNKPIIIPSPHSYYGTNNFQDIDLFSDYYSFHYEYRNSHFPLLISDCVNFNSPIQFPTMDYRPTNGFYCYNFYHLISNCPSFNQPIIINVGTGDRTDYLLHYCNSFNSKITIQGKVNHPISSIFDEYKAKNYNAVLDFSNLSTPRMYQLITNSSVFNSEVYFNNDMEILSNFFTNCTLFNQKINLPANLSNADYMFFGCSNFNQPITIPDTITNCYDMFYGCTNFNQPISLPNNVRNYSSMLMGTSYNCPTIIPNSINNIYEFLPNTFNSDLTITCPNINYIYVSSNRTYKNLYIYSSNLRNARFNSNIFIDNLFMNNTKLMPMAYNLFNQSLTVNNIIFQNGVNLEHLYTFVDNMNVSVTGTVDCRNARINNISYLFASSNVKNSVINCNLYMSDYTIQAAYLFANCTNFNAAITISNNLYEATKMFWNCNNFNQNISFPETTHILNSAFFACYNFNSNIRVYNSNPSIGGMIQECRIIHDIYFYGNNVNLAYLNVRSLNTTRLNIHLNKTLSASEAVSTTSKNYIVSGQRLTSFTTTTGGVYNSTYNLYILNDL